jgi:hypothetical protein
MDRYDLQQRYLDLTRVELPALARDKKWPIRFDHCFMRIILDHVFQDCWYDHLDRRLVAYKQLNDRQLAEAVELGEAMLHADVDRVSELNTQSLIWRGKIKTSSR